MPDKTDTNETIEEYVVEEEDLSNEKEKVLDKDNNKTDENNKLLDELLVAKKEAKESFEKMLRFKAELENYKKRTIREMDDLRKYATESIMREMLNVVDNLERAIKSSKDDKENVESIIKGVDLTLNEMVKILEKHNILPIKAVGKSFDPKIHQAMSQEESKYPPNTVIREFLKGYLIHDRLLRPAMVVVSSKKLEKS